MGLKENIRAAQYIRTPPVGEINALWDDSDRCSANRATSEDSAECVEIDSTFEEMHMQRRSNAVSGWVNFPVDDPAWKNTNEGGMVVKLVVCDNREFDDQFGVCSGAYVFDRLCEGFIADDRRPRPASPENCDSIEAIEAEQLANQEWEAYHFPNLHCDKDIDGLDRYASRPYLMVMVLGTTGWSGWSDANSDYWQCRIDDLSDEGKALYRQIEALYPGCELHLLTFLDT